MAFTEVPTFKLLMEILAWFLILFLIYFGLTTLLSNRQLLFQSVKYSHFMSTLNKNKEAIY